MTLQERLDADMRAKLRRGRPLPPLATLIGEPVKPPPRQKPKPPPAFGIPRIIPTALMCRADNLERQTAELTMRLNAASEKAKAVEDELAAMVAREPKLDVSRILGVVSEVTGITVGDLVSERRARHIARPRQVVMWLARKHTKTSLPKIGREIGFRDHTTVMHGTDKIDALLKHGDSVIQAWIDAAEKLMAVPKVLSNARG